MSKVVVTGAGLLTPLGLSRESSWGRLCAGESGIRALPDELGAGFACRHAGTIELGNDRTAWLGKGLGADPKDLPSKSHTLGLLAAREALDDAGLRGEACAALLLGNNVVEFDRARKLALWREWIVGGAGSAQAGALAESGGEFALGSWLCGRLGIRGPVVTFASNCVGGLQAIVLGATRIRSGRCDRVLVGGVDCAVTPEMLARFSLLHALTVAPGPDCCRPFDRAHSGMVLADGAGFLVLESETAARRRGARILAEIAGWGMTSDGYHVTRGAPDAQGKANALLQALRTAEVPAEAVDLVSAHGTGTVDNDITEVRALRLALGPHAEHVPITAAKSALGHSLAASGAVESVLAVLTLRDGLAPPILNLTEPADGCELRGYLRAPARLGARVILKNAFAFGGFNAAVVIRGV